MEDVMEANDKQALETIIRKFITKSEVENLDEFFSTYYANDTLNKLALFLKAKSNLDAVEAKLKDRFSEERLSLLQEDEILQYKQLTILSLTGNSSLIKKNENNGHKNCTNTYYKVGEVCILGIQLFNIRLSFKKQLHLHLCDCIEATLFMNGVICISKLFKIQICFFIVFLL